MEKNMVFISNGTKPTEDEANYIGEEKVTSFASASINAAITLGYAPLIGVNRNFPQNLTCELPVEFFKAEIFRNPFKLNEISKAYKNVVEVIRKKSPEFIHCNTPIGGLIGRIAGEKCGIKKVIYQAHGFHFYKGAPLLNWLIYYPIEKWLAKRTDALITINKEDFELAKQRFKLRNNGRVYYVPGVGINLTQYTGEKLSNDMLKKSLNINEDDFVLISMGDLVKRKNYSTAIEAIAKANNHKIKYIICGRGPEMENLKQLSEKLNVQDQVIFLGFRTDTKELMKIADAFLFTTLQEGLPRSMMEAMASGLPCIASKIRGNVDLIQDGVGGFLCDATNVDEFTMAIQRIIADAELRSRMSKNNLERIKDFDISVVEKEIRQIYIEVLQ